MKFAGWAHIDQYRLGFGKPFECRVVGFGASVGCVRHPSVLPEEILIGRLISGNRMFALCCRLMQVRVK